MKKISWIFFFISEYASSCPLCKTINGSEVSAGIFNEHFISNVISLIFPFIIFLFITLLIFFGSELVNFLRRIS